MDGKGMAGVAGLPQASNINGCDTETGPKTPAETAGNPRECRTSLIAKLREKVVMGGGYVDVHGDDLEQLFALIEKRSYVAGAGRTEIDHRLLSALQDAGHSALGMPSSVDTIKAMLARAGLALVLA